jgi:serine/threonine protein kinase
MSMQPLNLIYTLFSFEHHCRRIMIEGYKVFDNSGYTSTIYYLPGDPPRVCKSFNEDCIKNHFPAEKEAYKRFSTNNHPSSILNYYGIHDTIPAGIILELAEKKSLHNYRWDRKEFGFPDPETEVLYRWAGQAVEALEFAHDLGVYNSDIHCVNFVLDQDLNLKVGDWAGASIDGSVSQSSYRLRYRLFDASGTDVPRATGITALTEIFALGTALYYMVTCQEPWPDLREPEDREEIKKQIREKNFPDTSALPVLGDVISKCWNVEFTSMTALKHAIEAARKSNA